MDVPIGSILTATSVSGPNGQPQSRTDHADYHPRTRREGAGNGGRRGPSGECLGCYRTFAMETSGPISERRLRRLVGKHKTASAEVAFNDLKISLQHVRAPFGRAHRGRVVWWFNWPGPTLNANFECGAGLLPSPAQHTSASASAGVRLGRSPISMPGSGLFMCATAVECSRSSPCRRR